MTALPDIEALKQRLILETDAANLNQRPGLAAFYAEALSTITALQDHVARLEKVSMVAYLDRQKAFSERTFGPGKRTKGVANHIRKELMEIEAAPDDLTEWVDVILLAMDGAWRAGYSSEEIAAAIPAKHAKNEARIWPDWRTMSQDQAIEHDRAALAIAGEEK